MEFKEIDKEAVNAIKAVSMWNKFLLSQVFCWIILIVILTTIKDYNSLGYFKIVIF